MWQQYQKTFAGMQTVIFAVTIGVYFVSGHSFGNAAMSFVIMQLGSIVGAMWAVRLRTKMAQKQEQLPLSGRGL